jgi:NhaP-type Na+/H+ or K+/H+ antiporter
MTLFESLVLLLFVAALLLAGSRRLGIPYPTLLSIAGIGVALLPFAPEVGIEPHLALALFIAPALLDAGFDTSLRSLKRLWAPLLALAVGAVIATTLIVALIGWRFAGLPIAAALALGAIVAPPDAATANAMLQGTGFPRRSTLVLQGESLLNDATALLIFSAAVSAMHMATGGPLIGGPAGIALAAPGGVVLGLALGLVTRWIKPLFEATLSGIIIEFTMTFGAWLLAERLHLSPVLSVVAFALYLGARSHETERARDRIQSFAVWAAAVFILNVVAFLLMGLQARTIVADIGRPRLGDAAAFAGCVFLAVVATRIASVLGYRALSGWVWRRWQPAWLERPPRWRVSFLVAWCGMRGLLTLATAFALPADFPQRSLIVLSAFTVVIGTLVIQGLTLKPLMRLLGVNGSGDGFQAELGSARGHIIAAGIVAARREPADVASMLVTKLDAAREVAVSDDDRQGPTRYDDGMAHIVDAQREALHGLRRDGGIADDIFQRLQEELDWLELAARPSREIEVHET